MDYQKAFKAAKAQRGDTPGTSKQQLRAVRAQKAAAAAKAAADRTTAKQAAAQQDQHAMPPPALRGKAAAAAAQTSARQPASTGQQPGRAEEHAVSDGHPSAAADSRQAQAPQASMARLASTASTANMLVPSSSGRAAPPSATALGALPLADYGDDEDDAAPDAESSGLQALAAGDSASAAGTAAQLATQGSSALSNGAVQAASDSSSQAGGPGQAALPKGFFQDVAADAKARGEKVAKPKDPKQQYDDFMASIQEDVREVEEREVEEAEQAAVDKADQEAHEQRLRQEWLEHIKGAQASTADPGAGPSTAATGQAAVLQDVDPDFAAQPLPEAFIAPRKRRRAADVLEPGSSDSDDLSESDDDAALDWRSKQF